MKARKWLNALRFAVITLIVTLVSATVVACNKKKAKPGPEVGVYCCYDVGDEPYTLTLEEGKKFTFTLGENSAIGSYKISDKTKLKLDFKDKTIQDIVATYNETVIVISLNDDELSFYKEIDYTVSYDVAGGSAVTAATVTNGKTAEKPANPTKAGYAFVGWYEDSAFKTPFLFGVKKVTGDTTLYARWVQTEEGKSEYEISFDLNYEGAPQMANVLTTAGKVFDINAPAPTREGYDFVGWAISMYDNKSKLSYNYADGMSFAEDTTFVALWAEKGATKLPTPVVSVSDSGFKWNSINGASRYDVELIDPAGENVHVNMVPGSTNAPVQFEELAAGDYIVKVTAISSDASKTSDTAVRYYKNKALARVSHFSVEDEVLSFEGVANATSYAITIDCGDDCHNHVEMNIGNVTSYDFSTCQSKRGGIVFTITASAEGYASSTSREYKYVKDLGDVTGLKVDETTGNVVWNEVANAEKYAVVIVCGAHTHKVAYTTATQFSIKECVNGVSGIVINVYAMAEGFASSVPATVTYDKKALPTPTGIKIDGTVLSWTAVEGATSYEIKFSTGASASTDGTSIDLANCNVDVTTVADLGISIRAIGADESKNSFWSDEISTKVLSMASSISYNNGVLSWNHVIGAVSYEVKQNDEEIATVEDGSNFVNVTFTTSGDNKFEVRYIDADGAESDWVELIVTSYKVEFDTMDKYLTFPTQYRANGDFVEAFDDTDFNKAGYDFGGWYYDERVGGGNAERYVDQYFNEEGDIKLYATYTPKEYNVTFNYQGGTVSTGETQKTVLFGREFTFPVPTNADATKTFAGWCTAPNGGGIGLTDEKGKSTRIWPVAEDITVYAYWHANVFKYTKTRLPGSPEDVYSVAAGARINSETEITIPENYNGLPVKIVEANAFKDCAKLAIVNIPNTVELIFDGRVSAFNGCTALKEINVKPVEGNRVIRYWSKDGVLFDYGIIDEQNGESSVCIYPLGKQGAYVMPEGVHKIPGEAFKDLALTSITISSSVKYIGTDAFYSCDELTEVKFAPTPAGMTASPLEVDSQAFRSCTKLESITFPARLSDIKLTKYELSKYTDSEPPYQNISTAETAAGVKNPFISCSMFKEINVEEGGQYYSSQDGVLFNANKTELLYVPQYKRGAYTVPTGVKKIADGAFAVCYYLTGTLTIPASVETIGECAFYNAYAYKDLVFAGQRYNALSIGKYAFRLCSGFVTVTFEKNSKVSEIQEGAFYSCGYIKTIEIPATVETIADQAFRGCSSMSSVTFETSQTAAELTFGDAVFYGTKITEFNVPAHAVKLGGVLSGMDKLKKVNVDPNNANYASDADGILYDKDRKTLLYYPKTKTGNFIVPETVEVISAGVFANNSNLGEVTIGAKVKEIGDSAFSYCSRLTTVNFTDNTAEGASLTLGARVFYECRMIEEIELPVQTKSYGGSCFAYMDSLTTLTLNEGLTEMGTYGIYQCPSITSISIPSTVKKVPYYGIAENYGLKNITFATNTKGERAMEEFGMRAFYYNREVESIVVPKTVKKIGYYSLYMGGSSSKLSSVTFEEGSQLEEIGQYALYYTKNLKTITIPKSVVDIDYYAFAYSGIETIIFEQGGTAPLYLGRWKTYKTSPSSTSESVGYGYVFYSCDNLVRVDFPARLKEMGRYTFYDCAKLETVTFHTETAMVGGVETPVASRLCQIGEYCFSTCPNFKSIKIPKSVENQSYITDTRPGYTTNKKYMYNRQGVGEYAFRYNYSLESVVFEMGGTGPLTIGTGAFEDCESLTTITIPARLTTYNGYDDPNYGALGGSYKLGCTSLTEINIDATTTIPENEYLSKDGIVYTKDFKTVYLCPQGRTKTVTIDKDVTRIGDEAFTGCTKITSVVFEETTDAAAELVIGTSAFAGCTGIETITLSKHVTTIEPRAFENCTGLTTVNLSQKLTTSGFDASAFVGCDSLNQIGLSQNDEFAVQDGVLFNKDKTTLYYYPNSKADTTYTVPTGVREIYQAAFYGNNTLQKIILPSGVHTIGEEAFYGAMGLKEIYIPNSVTSIGDYAFYNCQNLETVTFEQGGEAPLEIGEADFVGQTNGTSTSSKRYGFTFAYCYSLETIVLPERTVSIADNTFWNCRGLKNIHIPENVEAIGRYAFYDCERLETVTFAEDIELEKFYQYTFAYCYSLDNFVVPASVAEFEKYVFYHCETMTTFSFEDGCKLEKLPNYTFGYCYALESIALPENLVEITNAASLNAPFYHCDSLTSVTFKGDKIEKIGNYAFYYCGSLETFVIPSSVIYLGNSVFYQCTSLDNVVIPDTITDTITDYIGTGVFYYCSSLTNVELPDNMDSIPNSFFYGCTSLKEFDIPDTVTDFGSSVFANTGIEEFVFPEFMTEVPSSFLESCKELTSITLHNKITSIGNYAFADTGLTEIDVPNSVETIDYYAFRGCEKLVRVKLPENADFTTISNYLFYGCTLLTEVEIPESVTYISYNAFEYSGLTEVVFPDSITDMDGRQFQECPDLKRVVLPSSMTYIPYNMFYNCVSLTEVVIPDNGMFTNIDVYAFFGCTSLTSIDIPATVTSIGEYAFSESGLTSFEFGDSLRTVAETAFFGCKDLATITVSEANSTFEMVNGMLMDEARVKLYMWTPAAQPDEVGGDTYTIPETVSLVGGAFAGVDNLKKVVLPASIKSIPNYLFYGATVEEVVIPEGVTTIGQYAFAESNVKTVTIPSTVEKVDTYAFQDADVQELTFAPVPTGKTAVPLVIGSYAFKGVGITSVTLPHRLRGESSTYPLGSYAFQNCEQLETVTFESNPATGAVYGTLFTGTNVFDGCSSLKSVTFPKELGRSPSSKSVSSNPALNSFVFKNCVELETVTFKPTEGYAIGFNTAVFFGCTSLAEFDFPETAEYVGLGMFYGCTALTEMVIPAGVTFSTSTLWSETRYDEEGNYSISHYGEMFAGCTNLTKVTINSADIGLGMFKDSCVTTIVINGTLKTIAARAFENCTTLTSFTIPTTVTSVAADAFAGWTAAQTVNVGRTVKGTYGWTIAWNANSEANFVYLP